MVGSELESEIYECRAISSGNVDLTFHIVDDPNPLVDGVEVGDETVAVLRFRRNDSQSIECRAETGSSSQNLIVLNSTFQRLPPINGKKLNVSLPLIIYFVI